MKVAVGCKPGENKCIGIKGFLLSNHNFLRHRYSE